MLESLDTLIAFVVIMSVASLLVTIVVQTISGFFSLRGQQLRRGLMDAIESVAPGTIPESKKFVSSLLKKEGFAAHWLPGWLQNLLPSLASAVRPEEIYASLQRLAAADATTIKAKEAELAGMPAKLTEAQDPLSKAKDEQKRLAQSKSKEDPELDENKRKAAEDIKNQESATVRNDSKRQLALAAEIALLKKFADANPDATGPSGTFSTQAASLLAALTPDAQKSAAIRNNLAPVMEQVAGLLIPEDDKKNIENAIKDASRALITEVDATKAAVEQWFNGAVDRAQEWFLGWIRAITITVGVLMAFVCQWDAVEIFKQVSGTNNALKNALVENRAIVLTKGEATLNVSEVGGGLLERLQKAWNEKHTPKLENLDGIKNISEMEAKIVGLVKVISAEEAKPEADKEAKKDPEVTEATPQQVADKAKSITDVNKAKTDFNNLLSEEENSYLKSQKEAFDSLAKDVSLNGFEFIPKDGWRWVTKRGKDGKVEDCDYWKHFFGMLIFAALLGLGAPFWFNILKNLSNLRPALAKLLDTENKPPAASR
jgi:chromosome segregation ATPase